MPRRAALGAGALVALVLLALWWRDPPVPPQDAPIGHVAANAGEPSRPRRAPPRDIPEGLGAPASPECPEAHRALEALTTSVPEACEAELLATRCLPPVEHSPLALPPERQLEIVREELATCPGLPEGAVRTDCSEYPCLVFVRWEEVESPRCEAIEKVAAIAGGRGEGIESEWLVFPQDAPLDDFGSRAPVVEARSAAREQSVAAWLADPTASVHRMTRSCGEAERLLAAASRMDPCERVRLARGCLPVEPDIDVAVVQRHLDAARAQVAALADRCPEFAARPFALDCSELPCVLGVDAADMPSFDALHPRGSPIGDALCGDGIVAELDLVYASGHPLDSCDFVAVIPLWDAGGLRDAEAAVEERYFQMRDSRLDTVCHAVEAVR